jgi:hypothetical protein
VKQVGVVVATFVVLIAQAHLSSAQVSLIAMGSLTSSSSGPITFQPPISLPKSKDSLSDPMSA